MVIERNKGKLLIEECRRIGLRLWAAPGASVLGYTTGPWNRKNLFDLIAQAVEGGDDGEPTITVRSRYLTWELGGLQEIDGKIQGGRRKIISRGRERQARYHDDHVIALALSLLGLQTIKPAGPKGPYKPRDRRGLHQTHRGRIMPA